MDKIMIVSSAFLDAVVQESNKFAIELIGCGNFSIARRKLIEINQDELLGICIIEKSLPSLKTKEGKTFTSFINLAASACNDMHINFISLEQANPDYVNYINKHPNLHSKSFSNVEYVTDTVIDRYVFGSLLSLKYKPYILKTEEIKALYNPNIPTIKIQNLISDYLLQVISKPLRFMNIEDAYRHDKPYTLYNEHNDNVMAFMRSLVLKGSLGLLTYEDYEEVHTMLYDSIEDPGFVNKLALLEFIWRNYSDR